MEKIMIVTAESQINHSIWHPLIDKLLNSILFTCSFVMTIKIAA